jgi:hypothetical protein
MPTRKPDPLAVEFQKQRDFEQHLHTELRGSGQVGRAFRVLVEAGCDPELLEHRLLMLRTVYPYERWKKAYSHKEHRANETAARKLVSAIDDLSKTAHADLMGAFSNISLKEIRSASDRLRAHAIRMKAAPGRTAVAADAIPGLVKQVRQWTGGRPYFKQLASVIGAAYGKKAYSADDLKVFDHRNSRINTARKR